MLKNLRVQGQAACNLLSNGSTAQERDRTHTHTHTHTQDIHVYAYIYKRCMCININTHHTFREKEQIWQNANN